MGEVPADRWAWFDDGSPEGAAALAGTTRWGSFLSDVDAFDAEFFEIMPSEATRMDPQQRLLLEVTHEALEHAGIPADSLAETQTGVFAGACAGDYAHLRVDGSESGGRLVRHRWCVEHHRQPGVVLLRPARAVGDRRYGVFVVAGGDPPGLSEPARGGFEPGPGRRGEPAALTGGDPEFRPGRGDVDGRVSVMPLMPAPTGSCAVRAAGWRCSSGSAMRCATGIGCLAVVRGSAVNQDGRSNGLMAPNPAAQMAVLRAAYAAAGVEPREVDYVEAHGTGTLLGDPIEARALGTVLGRGRAADAPLLIGAVKSNLGHLEAAAGIAGFAKAVLALQHSRIPANLGYQNPNPHIPFDKLRLKVVAEHTDWAPAGRPRRAGVSSFGFGGTNAHVVLEQAPADRARHRYGAPRAR